MPYPKNNILFSFKAREGEEWGSEDSEDSDYSPTVAEAKEAGVELERSVIGLIISRLQS